MHKHITHDILRRRENLHLAVEAAIVEPIGVPHRHAVQCAQVVHAQEQIVLTVAQVLGQFHEKGGRGSLVAAQICAVHEHLAFIGGRADAQKVPRAGGKIRAVDGADIPRGPLEQVVAFIDGLPGGRNRCGLGIERVPVVGKHAVFWVNGLHFEPARPQAVEVKIGREGPISVEGMRGATAREQPAVMANDLGPERGVIILVVKDCGRPRLGHVLLRSSRALLFSVQINRQEPEFGGSARRPDRLEQWPRRSSGPQRPGTGPCRHQRSCRPCLR